MSERKNYRNISIPAKEEPKYRNDIKFIQDHLGIDNYSESIRIIVHDYADWIKGKKELVDISRAESKKFIKEWNKENLPSYRKKI